MRADITFFQSIPTLAIGIDPGEDTGVAILDGDKSKFVELATMKFFEALFWINKLHEARKVNRNSNNTVKGVHLFIENPYLNRPVFPLQSETHNFTQAVIRSDLKAHEQALRMFARRAQNIGMNKRDAMRMIEYCKLLNFQVEEVKPSKGKISAEEFKQKTGYTGRSSQHARDAAMLVYPIK